MDADIKILKDEKERVIIAGIHTGSRGYINDTTDESMRELTELVETAGGEVVGELCRTERHRTAEPISARASLRS